MHLCCHVSLQSITVILPATICFSSPVLPSVPPNHQPVQFYPSAPCFSYFTSVHHCHSSCHDLFIITSIPTRSFICASFLSICEYHRPRLCSRTPCSRCSRRRRCDLDCFELPQHFHSFTAGIPFRFCVAFNSHSTTMIQPLSFNHPCYPSRVTSVFHHRRSIPSGISTQHPQHLPTFHC
jgi:hypothetical protein